MTPAPPLLRLAFLDALRGLAALMVVLSHISLLPDPVLEVPFPAVVPARLAGGGVSLFFAISAFSLFYTMPLRLREAKPLWSFYLHRMFRIAPLFYVWLAVRLGREAWFGIAPPPLAEVLATATFTFNLIPQYCQSFVWAGWTIGIEVIFYALFPLIYRWVRGPWSAACLFIVAVLMDLTFGLLLQQADTSAAWVSAWSQWSFFRHFSVFACGALAFHIVIQRADGSASTGRWLVGVTLVVAGIAVQIALAAARLPNLFGNPHHWQGVGWALLAIGLGLNPVALIVNTVTRYLGRISYSFYLNHPLLVFLLIPSYREIYAAMPNVALGLLASVALTLSILIPLSELTFRLIEQPGIALGRHLYRATTQRTHRPEPMPTSA